MSEILLLLINVLFNLLQIMKPCSSLCMGDCKHLRTPPSLLMDDSSSPAKQTNTFPINRRQVSSCTVISLIFVFFLFSSANALSQLDPINGIRLGWNKRGGGGSVNFSPGWGKRSNIPDLIHPDENLQENDLEISSQLEKRSGGSVNFSPGWGKRGGGGSVNFSPGWGKRRSMGYFPSSSKRAVNFSPSWGKRAVNFSPSWGKRNLLESRFSDLMGKRSGGSVNFSPGWGKRSGGSVNFSPSWGKRNAAWHQAPQIFRENLLQGNQGNAFIKMLKNM